MLYVHYIDRGPSGVCGQTMSITRHRNEIVRCNTYADYKLFELWVHSNNGRMGSRILNVWDDENVIDLNVEAVKKALAVITGDSR